MQFLQIAPNKLNFMYRLYSITRKKSACFERLSSVLAAVQSKHTDISIYNRR